MLAVPRQDRQRLGTALHNYNALRPSFRKGILRSAIWGAHVRITPTGLIVEGSAGAGSWHCPHQLHSTLTVYFFICCVSASTDKSCCEAF